MQRILLFLTIALLGAGSLHGQGYYFGLKGGLTVGVQNWEGIEQDPLYKYHGIAFVESYTEDNEFAIFGQLGYHVKGSAFRFRTFFNPINGNVSQPPAQEFEFYNLSLTAGAKQKYALGVNNKFYYLIGVRLDYTLDTNLDQYSDFNERNPAFAIYPFDDPVFIQEFNYGATVGGGLEFPFSEFVGLQLEFTVNPDFSYQYKQPESPPLTDPYTGNQRVIPERKIRNLTFEVSLGFRFLRKVEYID